MAPMQAKTFTVLAIVASLACDRSKPAAPAATSNPAAISSLAAPAELAPWQTLDPGFKGCEGG